MRTFIKKFKNSILGKILKLIWNLIIWAIEFLIIFIALIIVVQRVSNNESSFLGFRVFNVATKSMEPEYVRGDILIARETEPKDIKVGDNVVYLGMERDYKNKIITHRVMKIEQSETGEYIFHTKGIANDTEDPIVYESQVYGTVVLNSKIIAFICRIIGNKLGLYLFVILPIILYAFGRFIRIQTRALEQEKEELKKKELEQEKEKKSKKSKPKKDEEQVNSQELPAEPEQEDKN